ncbi:hypothetical protein J3459_002515 [Metarhizium acridum]|nr:hypothetical protein J3459_002515 [Metarhizium acridum]
MQALSLQLAYDNLKIILHRSAAFRVADDASRVDATSISSPFSHRQLFEAAIRTSDLHKYAHVLRECQRTHANMHIGITLFTAGVVLCAICLFQPMSKVSQRAKTGISHHPDLPRQLVGAAPRFGPSLVVGGRGGTGVLDPLQEVFERHVQRPAPPGDAQKGLQPGDDNMGQHRNPGAESGAAQVVDPATGFDWDGELSLLADSGLGDASQLWLWADNLNHDSFAEFNDARLRQACYRLAPSTTSRWKSSRMPNKHSPDAGELLEAADEQAICGDSHPTSSTNLIWRGSVLTDTMSCWSRI